MPHHMGNSLCGRNFSPCCVSLALPSPWALTVPTEKKLEEFSVEEAKVLQILTQVNVVRRECEIVSVGELVLGV